MVSALVSMVTFYPRPYKPSLALIDNKRRAWFTIFYIDYQASVISFALYVNNTYMHEWKLHEELIISTLLKEMKQQPNQRQKWIILPSLHESQYNVVFIFLCPWDIEFTTEVLLLKSLVHEEIPTGNLLKQGHHHVKSFQTDYAGLWVSLPEDIQSIQSSSRFTGKITVKLLYKCGLISIRSRL